VEAGGAVNRERVLVLFHGRGFIAAGGDGYLSLRLYASTPLRRNAFEVLQRAGFARGLPIGARASFSRGAGVAGVDVTLEVHPEMIHGFQGLASAGIPEGISALTRVGDFLRRMIP
jgi:hypothetical protein